LALIYLAIYWIRDIKLFTWIIYITGSLNNIKYIKNDKFKFIEYNVTLFINLEGSLDYILHFASPASPIGYLKFPIPTLKVGALGIHNALGLAKKKNLFF